MKSFTVVLLLTFVSLAFSQSSFGGRRLNADELRDMFGRDMFGRDADDLFKRLERDFPRTRNFPNPRDRRPDGGRNQMPQPPKEDQRSNPGQLLNKQTDCKCRMGSTSRIVNGQIAAKNSIPWQVSLASWDQHFCGASIINSLYILTAAHCIEGKKAKDVQVRVGLHRLSEANPSNTYAVERIISYEYTTPSKPGDIAILKLAKPIKFVSGQIEPGCINLEERDYPNDLIASGWGTTTVSIKDGRTGELRTGEVSPVLKKANLHQSKDRCENYLICVDSNNGDSVCQGDSGGPLNYVENGRSSIQGVASFVTGSGRPGSDIRMCTGRGAYSKNAYYKQWFKQIIGDNHCSL